MKILVSYRGIPQSPGWATGDMVVRALRALGHEAYSYAKYYQQPNWVEGKPYLDDHEWDLILYMECNDGDPQYHELAVARARKTACWLFDTSYYSDRCRSLINYFKFDHIFLANPLTIRDYKTWGYKNVSYLPYACDSKLHMRPLDFPKVHDVVLVGSIRNDRKCLANELALQGIDLKLIGGVFREAYIDALASAKFVINQNPPEGRGLLNMRHFEAQAAGAIIIEQENDLLVNCEAGLFCNMPSYDPEDLNSVKEAIEIFGNIENDVWARSFNGFLERENYQRRCESILETVFPHG